MKRSKAWLAASPGLIGSGPGVNPLLGRGAHEGRILHPFTFHLGDIDPRSTDPDPAQAYGPDGKVGKGAAIRATRKGSNAGPDLSGLAIWVLRPLQGIGLSLIFAKFLNSPESSIGTSRGVMAPLALYVIGSALVSLLL